MKRQRLIYAGHCLDNDATIESFLRRSDDGDDLNVSNSPQVIHMVCANKEALVSPKPILTAETNEIRHRRPENAPEITFVSANNQGPSNVNVPQAQGAYPYAGQFFQPAQLFNFTQQQQQLYDPYQN